MGSFQGNSGSATNRVPRSRRTCQAPEEIGLHLPGSSTPKLPKVNHGIADPVEEAPAEGCIERVRQRSLENFELEDRQEIDLQILSPAIAGNVCPPDLDDYIADAWEPARAHDRRSWDDRESDRLPAPDLTAATR